MQEFGTLISKEDKIKKRIFVVPVMVFFAVGALRLGGKAPAAQSMVDMKGVQPSLKLQQLSKAS